MTFPLAVRWPAHFAAIALALLLVAPAAARAQTVTGTIQGTVIDTTGGAVPGVTVVVRNADTGGTRETVTNERGFYDLPFLPLGRYEATATLSGFGPVTKRDLEVRLNFTTVVDFKLDPQALKETVEVTAARPKINLTNGSVSGSLTSEQILEKPTFQNLNNNNTFLSLAETFTGFQENPTSGQNNPTASSGSSVNFNGAGTRGTTFQIDGINNDDSSENQNRQGVNLAAIKEFQVVSNTYSADLGRGNGAVVLVQTKSGTNRPQGEVYWYGQNNAWNSNDFFSKQAGRAKADNQRNNIGGVFGFPIVRDKFFGFISVDQAKREGNQAYVRDLFTAAELARPRLTRGNDTPENRAFIESVLARFGDLQPNDPRSPRTYSGLVDFEQPVADYSARLDWQPNSRDTLTARYQYSRQKFDNQDIILGEATQQNNRQANVGLTWTHTWSPTMVGEFRYGLGIRDTNVNIKAGNDTPIVRFAGSPVSGSIIGNAGNFPILRDQMDNQFVYNLSSWIGASHSVKVGTDIRLSALDDRASNFDRGFWNFNANCGGVVYPTSYAAFLDGCIANFTVAYGPFSLENRINEANFYVEDNWRVRPNLTLNLGLRYELAGAAYEAEDRIDYVYGNDTDNIEPRVGFAWSPQWEDGALGWLAGAPGESSIRGGYGLFHGRIFQSVFSQGGASVRFNPPDAISLSFTTLPNILNVSDPTLGYEFVPGPQTTRHAEAWIDPELEMPETHQWNLTIERAMPWQSTFRASYVGLKANGLLQYDLANLAVTPAEGGIVVVNHPNNAPAPGFPDLRGVLIDRVAADYLCAGTGFLPGLTTNATCPVPVPIANNEISLRAPRTNERRPDPLYTTNTVVSNGSNAWSHGLQLEWIKRTSNGVRFEANYTWSKAIDEGSEATAVGTGDSNILGPDPRFYRGLSRFHTPHRFTLNGTWLMPFFKDQDTWTGAILGGWQVAGVLKLAHGTPFTVINSAGGDLNWDGFSENRPVILDPSLLGETFDDLDRDNITTPVIPASAFRRATPDDYDGDLVGRNTFYLAPLYNVDLAIYKSFALGALGAPGRIMLRVEAYNLFDYEKWSFPNNDFNSTSFGRITSQANSPRAWQIGVRYIF